MIIKEMFDNNVVNIIAVFTFLENGYFLQNLFNNDEFKSKVHKWRAH